MFYRNCVHFYTFIYNVIISIMIAVFCRLSYGVIRMGVLSLQENCIVSRTCCIEIIQFARFVVAHLPTTKFDMGLKLRASPKIKLRTSMRSRRPDFRVTVQCMIGT